MLWATQLNHKISLREPIRTIHTLRYQTNPSTLGEIVEKTLSPAQINGLGRIIKSLSTLESTTNQKQKEFAGGREGDNTTLEKRFNVCAPQRERTKKILSSASVQRCFLGRRRGQGKLWYGWHATRFQTGWFIHPRVSERAKLKKRTTIIIVERVIFKKKKEVEEKSLTTFNEKYHHAIVLLLALGVLRLAS